MNERPAREHVTEKLERLSNLRGAAEVARLNYEAKRAEILKQIQAELDALDAEYNPVLEAAGENIAALENEIKTDVLLFGESLSGGMYRASYTQGRVSWDNDGMTKYAALHPDVLQFRKQGQPIVSLTRGEQRLNLPSEFIRTIESTYGEDGKQLIAKHSRTLIEEASQRWGLTDVQPVPNLSYNFVAFANRGDE